MVMIIGAQLNRIPGGETIDFTDRLLPLCDGKTLCRFKPLNVINPGGDYHVSIDYRCKSASGVITSRPPKTAGAGNIILLTCI
jgi:hypothetical protein